MSKQHHQEQIQEEWDQETNVQRDELSPKPQNLLLLEQQLLMKSCSTPMEATTASEREEVTGGHVHVDSLESSDNSTPFSMFGSRLDDEDPIFTLDEEVQAKELFGERTRHYTADFDPTASDEDEFPKEIGNLNGGRAYSASNRFPPRVRHSGRPGNLPNAGILHKLHGQHGNAAGPGQMVPASLPIQISRGFVWPPRDLVENLSEEEDTSGGVDMISAKENIIIEQRERAKTIQNDTNTSVVGEEQNHDSEREDVMYGRIRAYSRSIQPDDDPERVFGERPHRRYSSSLKYGDISVDFDLNEGSTEVANESGGENIPPLAFFNSISSSIPNSNRVSVGGTADSSSTATTPRVVMPQLS